MKSLFRKLMFWRSSVPRVAMVRLAGVIASGGSPLRRGLNLDAVDPLLKKAFGLRRTKAVVLVINSPGGSPVQSALIGAGFASWPRNIMYLCWRFAKMWRLQAATGWPRRLMKFTRARLLSSGLSG